MHARVALRSDAEVGLRDLLARERVRSRPRATRGLPGSSTTRCDTRCASADVLLDDRPRVMPSAQMRRQRVVDLLDHDRRQAQATARRTAARCGLPISARPIATICCWPPDSAVAGLRALLARGSGTARRQSLQVPRPRALARTRPSAGSPRRVRLGNRRRPSGTIAMPAPHDLARRQAADRLALEARPRRAARCTRPVSALRKVLLPAPFAPMIATTSPASSSKSMPNSACASP